MLQSSRSQSSNLHSLVEAIEVIERVRCVLTGKKQADEEDSHRAEAGAARCQIDVPDDVSNVIRSVSYVTLSTRLHFQYYGMLQVQELQVHRVM